MCVNGHGYVYVCKCYVFQLVCPLCVYGGVMRFSGVLDVCVSFVSCIVMMAGCVLCASCCNSAIFYLFRIC